MKRSATKSGRNTALREMNRPGCGPVNDLKGNQTTMRLGFAFVLAIAICALTAILSGCGGGGNGTGLPDPIIRFVNSSPDSNPLDFFINADNKAPAQVFPTSSPEITTKKGDKDISVQDSTSQTELDGLAVTF